MSKVSVIGGAGFVGQMVGFGITRSEVVEEVALVDIIEDKPQGIGLDIRESTPIYGSDTKIYGTNDYEDITGSDIVVVTAGFPRKPGMDRMDLLKKNVGICKDVVTNVKEYAPDAIIIYVANPVDVLTYAAKQVSGFPANRVFGMAGVLDTARYRAFISMEANVSTKDIRAMVLGGHGDSMVPLPRYTTIGGLPLSEFISEEKIEEIVERTRNGGGEIVDLLGDGSAYYAPGMAVTEMVEAIINDQKRVLPVVAYLNDKYGFNDVYAGAPVILGENGVERVIEIELNDDEMEAYTTSVNHVKEGVEDVKSILEEQ